jgi:hypothetical protein
MKSAFSILLACMAMLALLTLKGSAKIIRQEGPDCALLIRCNHYRHQDISFQAPEADTIQMKAVLEKLGFAVTICTDPTGVEMRHALESFSNEAATKQRGQVVVYFTGKAVEVAGELCFLGIDSDAEEKAPIAEESLPLSRVYASFQSIGAAHHYLVADSCRFSVKAETPMRAASTLPEDTTTWFSCGSGEASYATAEFSLFTKAWCEALADSSLNDSDKLKRIVDHTTELSRASKLDTPQRPGFYTNDLKAIFPHPTEFKKPETK